MAGQFKPEAVLIVLESTARARMGRSASTDPFIDTTATSRQRDAHRCSANRRGRGRSRRYYNNREER
jgi:hypothetical protein